METKICNKCKIEKNKDCYFTVRKKSRKGTILYCLDFVCIDCKRELGRERRAKLKLDPENRIKENKRAFEIRGLNPEKEMFIRAQKRAVKKNIIFNIELSDIIIPEICPILEIPLQRNINGAGDNSPSLDKIINEKGYIKNNIRVVSRLANIMKAHATNEQILLFAKNIGKYLSPE